MGLSIPIKFPSDWGGGGGQSGQGLLVLLPRCEFFIFSGENPAVTWNLSHQSASLLREANVNLCKRITI